MLNQKEIAEAVSSYLEDHFEKTDEKSASNLFKQGVYHLKEAYLFLDGCADKQYLEKNDLPEEVVQAALEVSKKLRELHANLSSKQK